MDVPLFMIDFTSNPPFAWVVPEGGVPNDPSLSFIRSQKGSFFCVIKHSED